MTSDKATDANVSMLIPGYGRATFPCLADLGGEAQVFASDPVDSEDPFSAVLALCSEWADIEDRGTATSWIAAAMPVLGIEELVDFNDVALTAAPLLPDIAATLEAGWMAISADVSSRGNVALEGWARLALGGWTSSTLPLRAALSTRAASAATESVEADIFLVRSLGAALDQWSDHDLEAGLERLSAVEDIECDVAFELAMRELRHAVEAHEPTTAASALDNARDLFHRANEEGARPDAVAFNSACLAVASFIRGDSIPDGTIETIELAIRDWYEGYLGLAPHWRQARAQTGGAWAALVLDLEKVAEVSEPSWLDPMQLLADVGRIYLSHSASTLLANPIAPPSGFADLMPAAVDTDGAHERATDQVIAVALVPVLDANLAASSHTEQIVVKWLNAVSANPPETTTAGEIEAIAAALERIRATPPPGKGGASRDQHLPETLREALKETLGDSLYATVTEVLGRHLGSTIGDPGAGQFGRVELQLTLNQDRLLRRLSEVLAALRPEESRSWGPYLNLFLTVLIRAAVYALDQEQGGKKALPWHTKVEADKVSPEHHLADYLAQAFVLSGLTAYVEIPNVGGGRADVLVQLGKERLVIEVKRITSKRTDSELTAEFGPQASQYTITGAPFAFLAVLDTTRHDSHLDLFSSFWVDEWVDPAKGMRRPLVGLRVLSNVPTPSEMTKEVMKAAQA